MEKMTWLTLSAAVIGVVIQLIKTDKFDGLLARFGLPSLPRRYLPWIALGLGLVAGFIQVQLDPSTNWQALVADLVNGMVSGALPVATHELTRKEGS